tara:strand:- start:351 stop:704 length:354 start_codon:yes stop_codon:yes gene_type:complete
MIWYYLPDDAKCIIKEYITNENTSILSKTNFNQYYDVPDKKLLRRLLLNVIRKDHDFVFEKLLNNHYNQFKNTIRYRYQGKTYKHFAEFLKYRIIENESSKCKNILFEKLTNEYKWM